jgi:NAD(P)-dependent dehydrogenase (short-subunit alcohol dehydrogenase family)
MGRLDGRVAVVTGGASGIGEGIAARFAEEGARVVVADVDVAGGEAVAKSVDGLFVECDVTREADLARAVDVALAEFGGLHCFVGNAGYGGVIGPITELDEDGFDRTVAVLLKGVAFGMKDDPQMSELVMQSVSSSVAAGAQQLTELADRGAAGTSG